MRSLQHLVSTCCTSDVNMMLSHRMIFRFIRQSEWKSKYQVCRDFPILLEIYNISLNFYSPFVRKTLKQHEIDLFKRVTRHFKLYSVWELFSSRFSKSWEINLQAMNDGSRCPYLNDRQRQHLDFWSNTTCSWPHFELCRRCNWTSQNRAPTRIACIRACHRNLGFLQMPND